MADSINNGEFWLPPEFLTDHDNTYMNTKQNLHENGFNNTNLCLPTEFPYDLGYLDPFGSSTALSFPVESVVSSTETETDEEEELLTVLTRQLTRPSLPPTQKPTSRTQNLEKSWVMAGLPQSTLSGLGSWSSNGSPNGPSQVCSPRTMPFGVKNDAALDLIYQVASQIARLKMSSGGPIKPRGLLNPSRTLNNGLNDNPCLSHTVSNTNHGYGVWNRQDKEVWYSENQISQNRGLRVGLSGDGGFVERGRCGNPMGLGPAAAWPPLQLQNNNGSGMRVAFLGGPAGGGGGVKRQCVGTGVFLPRTYEGSTARKQRAGGSTALLPARVVQAPNKNFEHMNFHAQSPSLLSFKGSFIPDYDLSVARRPSFVSQQKRSIRPEGAMNHEIHLPQEWTY